MANRIQDAFDNIKAEPQMVESTKQFLSEKRRKKSGLSRRPMFPKALAAACMALLLVVGVGGYFWVQSPVSYVGIDVNPSMELALNRFDKVVSVKAFNAEAEEILQELSLKGKYYTDAIDLIMGCKAMEGYLAKKAELVFTVAADSSREGELMSGVEHCAGHSGIISQSISVGMETALEAHVHGLSLGKYHAWLQLIQYDDTVTVDECKDMSMSEIHNLIKGHAHGGGQGEGSQDGETVQEEAGSHEEGHGQENMEDQGHSQEEMEGHGEGHSQEEMEGRKGGYRQEKNESHGEKHRQEESDGHSVGHGQEMEKGQGMDYQQGGEDGQDRKDAQAPGKGQGNGQGEGQGDSPREDQGNGQVEGQGNGQGGGQGNGPGEGQGDSPREGQGNGQVEGQGNGQGESQGNGPGEGHMQDTGHKAGEQHGGGYRQDTNGGAKPGRGRHHRKEGHE
ncbi:MAG: hypothetical protein HFH38_12750 [Lachnospiraceae bacterium]|nr:hypothetical protein [Lachnospiraceae bacterium]